MAGTARTAGALYGVLDALRSDRPLPADLGIDTAAFVGRPARAAMDVIANAIRPADGTLDAVASRQAMDSAVSDLLEAFPDANLAALQEDQIDLVVERYTGHDLCHRIELDIGRAIELKAPDAATAVRRLEEIRDYVVAEVGARFAARRARGERLTGANAARLVSSVLRDTLTVFEEYIQ